MIFDLGTHIKKLIDNQHEVILFIDANEPHIYCSGIDRLIKRIKIIDPILVRHGCATKPNTHKRGADRIDFVLCTQLINDFITKCGITPFDQISQSDHRGIYLDIQVKSFLQEDIVSLALTSRILSIKSPDHVSTYKTELQKFIKANNIVKSNNNINIKIKIKKTLQPIDMIMINALDNTITKGMLQAEKN